MTATALKIFLPGFALVFLWIILFWNSYKKFGVIDKLLSNEKQYYNRLKRLHYICLFIMTVFLLMIFLYSLFLKVYNLFLPIDKLDHPVINSIGIIILKFALGWTFISQIMLDKSIYHYSEDIESLSRMERVFEAERNLIKGLLMMFIGVFTTISNIIGIGLCLFAVLFYLSRNIKGKSYQF